MASWERWEAGSIPRHSVLRLWHRRSCIIGHNYSSDLIPAPGAPYAVAPKGKKKNIPPPSVMWFGDHWNHSSAGQPAQICNPLGFPECQCSHVEPLHVPGVQPRVLEVLELGVDSAHLCRKFGAFAESGLPCLLNAENATCLHDSPLVSPEGMGCMQSGFTQGEGIIMSQR